MNRAVIARIAAGAVAAVIAFASPPHPSHATPPQVGEVIAPSPPSCFGEYRSRTDPNTRIVVEPIGDPTLVRVRTSAGWGAIGYLERDRFEGVMRAEDMQGSRLPGKLGRLAFSMMPDGTLRAAVQTAGDTRTEVWTPLPSPRELGSGNLDELPEAVLKPAPAYPPAARRAGIEGTVMVNARVGVDGRVRETRVLRSVPQLDAAAVAAVKQWTFKPALLNGRPTETWVAVPVKFALN